MDFTMILWWKTPTIGFQQGSSSFTIIYIFWLVVLTISWKIWVRQWEDHPIIIYIFWWMVLTILKNNIRQWEGSSHYNLYILVDGFNHLEKYEFVNGKDHPIIIYIFWWMVLTILKNNIRQWEGSSHILWKNMDNKIHVPVPTNQNWFYDVFLWIWVNYNISLTWIKAIWGWFP